MRKREIVAVSAALALLVTAPLAAQQKRVSPHETVSATVGGSKVTIEYGRPYLKGRQAVGGKLVPFSSVWRTGADEATVLTTDGDLMIGTVKVPAGSYSLFTLPTDAKNWTLIINKTAKQWGAFSYDEKADLGRTPMKVTTPSSPVEQFTIKLTDGSIELMWENTAASVSVKPAR